MIRVGRGGDGAPLRTPGGAVLEVPTPGLAEALTRERETVDRRDPEPLPPLTKLACAALDRVAPDRAGAVAGVVAYGNSELLAYRADAPAELALWQAGRWDPVLDWVHAEFGVRWKVTTGVTPVDQSPEVLAALETVVSEEEPFALAALSDMVTLSGSVLLGLAALRGHLAATAAWELSVLDETWQEERWGRDEEAAAVAANRREAFLAAEAFLVLIGRIQPAS